MKVKCSQNNRKLKWNNELEWFKAKTDKTFKESEADNNTRRTEIELQQLHDGDPYNDKIVQMNK